MLCAALGALALAAAPASAPASTGQRALFEDDANLLADPVGTLNKLRVLGVSTVRVGVVWSTIAPHPLSRRRPRGFDASDPSKYPAANWTTYDAIVRDAQADGIEVNFLVSGGAPLWADGPGAPRDKPHPEWMPSAREYGLFVRALGARYSGAYTPARALTPLPRVKFWAIWNEPNFGEDLAPQAIKGSTVSVAPGRYRGLVDAAWSAFRATGHGRDTILIGELAARGLSGPVSRHAPQGFPGNFAQTKPLQFIRTLYCVDSAYRELRRAAARARGCPTTAAGSRRFRAAHPGLFRAGGFGIHPYPQDLPPTEERSKDPDYAAFSELPRLERELDRLQRVYASGARFRIYNDEYGYITNPPNHGRYVSPATAAYYINWAEYLSWRSPRIETTMQYLLQDPAPTGLADFASGLLFLDGRPKPSYFAYGLPLYLPATTSSSGNSLEVWGCARPAHFALTDPGGGAQSVQVQFQPSSGGDFSTVQTVPITDPHGYFDVRLKFPSSGTVRLAYTYPKGDALLPVQPAGYTLYSRSVQVTIH